MTLLAPLRFCFEDSGGADEAEDHHTTAASANHLRVAASASLNTVCYLLVVAYSIWKAATKGTGMNQKISKTLCHQLTLIGLCTPKLYCNCDALH